jgi:hypothetical protein
MRGCGAPIVDTEPIEAGKGGGTLGIIPKCQKRDTGNDVLAGGDVW